MLRLRKWVYHGVRSVFALHRWARRRFTRAGLALLGGALVAGFMGLDTDQNIAYQAFSLLACLLFVAVIGSGRFSGKFSARRVLPRFGTVGSPLAYTVFLRNLSAQSQTGLALLDRLAGEFPTLEEFVALQTAEEKQSFRLFRRRQAPIWSSARVREQALPVLPARQEVEIRLELLPLKRGRLRFLELNVGRADVLGLYKSAVRLPQEQSLLILPKRYHVPPLALPGSRKYQLGGVALASSVGESEEFVSLRDYRQGDPLRHIHWRSWAKVGKPIVREFEDEFFVRHALILDTFIEHPQSLVFEEAVSVAASFACTLQAQDSLLDLMFVGPEAFCFTVGRGLGHTEQMLEILAAVRVCRERPFSALQNLVLEHLADVSGCVCVFLAWDEPRRELAKRLRLAGVPIKVLVVREAGATGALDPGPLRDLPGAFHSLELGSIAESLAGL